MVRPSTSSETEGAALHLLLPLLLPIGEHRKAHTQPSKGRGRKRKKSVGKPKDTGTSVSDDALEETKHVTTGFNSTLRRLEKQIHTAPQDASSSRECDLAVVFVCRASLPPPTCNSLPLLITSASLNRPGVEAIRLVELTASGEAQIAGSLALPRVGMIALISGFPGAGPLLQYLRETVKPMATSWLTDASVPTFLPTKIDTLETRIGPPKSSKKRKSAPG